jgi:fructuronate reductase
VRRPGYDRSAIGIGIVHIGPGAFHRAHQAVYVDDLLVSDPRWAISAVSLKSPGTRDALAPQDGLYTLSILDEYPSMRVVGALKEMLVAPEAPELVAARLAQPRVRVVTITVTEKGYQLDGAGNLDLASAAIRADLARPDAPRTLVGTLVEALRSRRAAGARPLTIISCDNLPENGIRLRRAVCQFAAEVDPDLARWIEAEARFPRTMVDSITPATDDALRMRVAQTLGFEDRWPIQRESFVQWVLEDNLGSGGPDWQSVGVTVTSDVTSYERAKIRLLNGAHSTLAYLGLLRDHETVFEAVADAPLANFVGDLMSMDILPTLHAPAGLDLDNYAQTIFRRFRNPEIRHNLAQIAWDGTQKLPIRILATIEDALRIGRPIDRLCVPIAAWMHFVRRASLEGRQLVDPLADRLTSIGIRCRKVAAADVRRFLEIGSMFGTLSSNPNFVRAVEFAYMSLDNETAVKRAAGGPASLAALRQSP